MGQPVLVAAAVLYNGAGELLMALRADRLQWEVPGGKVGDETLTQAFRRELAEETGMVSDEDPVFLGVSEPDPAEFAGTRFVIHFLLVRSWRGFPQRMEPEKCLALRWFPADRLPPPERLTPGTRDFVMHILPALVAGGEAA